MPRLVEPTTTLHAAWLRARDDWGSGLHEDGFGLRAEDEVDSPEGFAVWVDRLRQDSDAVAARAAGRVPATYWWVMEGDAVVGGIALRHDVDDFSLRVVGQIGYGICPSARGRGLATWALGEVLSRAGTLGLTRVLVTCADGNLPSARVIERHGGVLEDVRDTEWGRARRYWIALAA